MSTLQKVYLCYYIVPTFNHITSIKSFDFSTLYTTIPHHKLKDRLTSIIRNAFIFKNGNRRYKYLVLGHEETYFVKENSDSKNKYSEDDIIKMLEFLVYIIFVDFAEKVFQQTVGIPMGTNCAPLLADLFLYSYEADFIQSLLSTLKKHFASRFNLTYRGPWMSTVVLYCWCHSDSASVLLYFTLQVHRWCIVHKQHRIRNLSGPDVSCWTWDQRHHREHQFCFLPRFTTVDWEGCST